MPNPATSGGTDGRANDDRRWKDDPDERANRGTGPGTVLGGLSCLVTCTLPSSSQTSAQRHSCPPARLSAGQAACRSRHRRPPIGVHRCVNKYLVIAHDRASFRCAFEQRHEVRGGLTPDSSGPPLPFRTRNYGQTPERSSTRWVEIRAAGPTRIAEGEHIRRESRDRLAGSGPHRL
jgi:hypothetical protein